MAGTLTISTLSDGTNTTSTTNLVRAPCVAWVNFNGNTATIRASYNVSSITKDGTGNYVANITNALPNSDYAVLLTIDRSGDAGAYGMAAYPASRSTNAVRIYCQFRDGVFYDQVYVGMTIVD